MWCQLHQPQNEVAAQREARQAHHHVAYLSVWHSYGRSAHVAFSLLPRKAVKEYSQPPEMRAVICIFTYEYRF